MELEELIPKVTKHLKKMFPFVVDLTMSNQHLPSHHRQKIFIHVTLSPNHYCETFLTDIDSKISEIIISEATLYLRASFPELLEKSGDIIVCYYPAIKELTLIDEASRCISVFS